MQDACDKGLDPDEFVEDMKKKGIRVAGIGHRIKSKVHSSPSNSSRKDSQEALPESMSQMMGIKLYFSSSKSYCQ